MKDYTQCITLLKGGQILELQVAVIILPEVFCDIKVYQFISGRGCAPDPPAGAYHTPQTP